MSAAVCNTCHGTGTYTEAVYRKPNPAKTWPGDLAGQIFCFLPEQKKRRCDCETPECERNDAHDTAAEWMAQDADSDDRYAYLYSF